MKVIIHIIIVTTIHITRIKVKFMHDLKKIDRNEGI